jgi:hypothetical protein
MKFGINCKFDSIPNSLKAQILSGPVNDQFIARELYGDPTVPVLHTKEDFSIVEVDPAKLLGVWRPYFTPLVGTSPADAAMPQIVEIGGLDLQAMGNQADFLRQLYRQGDEAILASGKQMLGAGKGEGEVARWVVDQRNNLKVTIRQKGPDLFRKIAEWRNQAKYGNPIGPSYEQLSKNLAGKVAAEEIDRAIIGGVTKTSKGFNAAGGNLRMVGVAGEIVGVALMATQDSPAAATPLPKTIEEQVEAERARLRYGIPAGANIDRHGHAKPNFYLQVDTFDPHASDEFDAETDEILWWLGVDITYHYGAVRWTVPGR